MDGNLPVSPIRVNAKARAHRRIQIERGPNPHMPGMAQLAVVIVGPYGFRETVCSITFSTTLFGPGIYKECVAYLHNEFRRILARSRMRQPLLTYAAQRRVKP